VTRLTTPVVAVVVGLAFATPARAQDPTKLWSEYPLVPKVEQAAPSPVGPFLPPSGVEPPVKDESSGTGYWLPLLAVAAIALLVATRFARPLAATGGHALHGRIGAVRDRTRRPRPTRRSPTRPAERPLSARQPVQYAPTTVPGEAEAEVEIEAPRSVPAEFVPYVTRRSGLVRSRYVVVTDDSGRTAERSRAFWLIGDAAAQQRRAEAAWDDLANQLRADGWELDMAGRYEYYVPLRRAIISTLEPYG
jgi:hypothetical protein